MHGQGILSLYMNYSYVVYEGEFVKGIMHGQGKLS